VDSRAIESICRIIDGARLYALQSFRGKEVLHPKFFEGIRAGYDHDEMMALKSLAEPWVANSIVR